MLFVNWGRNGSHPRYLRFAPTGQELPARIRLSEEVYVLQGYGVRVAARYIYVNNPN